MSQTAVSISLVAGEWVGTLTDLTDGDDSTTLRAPVVPDVSKAFVVMLGPLVDPGVDTGHILHLRAALDTIGGTSLMLVLLLENNDDGSQVTYAVTSDLTDAFADLAFPLEATDMALVHDYGQLRVSGYWYAGETMFGWDTVAGATSYRLQIGTATGLSDSFNTDVGYVLSYGVVLTHGTYYWRVVPYTGAVPGTPTTEGVVVVP